jgi:hypothetical protein
MKTVLLFIVISVFLVSCDSQSNPFGSFDHDYKLLIEPTGKSADEIHEFRFRNMSAESVGYHGYSKNYPLYVTQVLTDSGWISHGGWCGTGVSTFYLTPYESITVDVFKPPDTIFWRVGLYTINTSNDSTEISWSATQL